MSLRRDTGSGLTYADAGVDIDAGNALVERSSRWCAPPRRRGADAEIGGFGAAVRPQGRRLHRPDPGRDHRRRRHQAQDRRSRPASHATIGIDLVAMCVNDLVVQGAEPLFFLDYFATGKLDPVRRRRDRRRHRRGLPDRRLRADRRRDRRDAGHVRGRRLRPRRLRGRRRRARPAAAARRRRGRRRGARPRLLGRALQRLFAGAPDRRATPGFAWDAPAPFAPDSTLGRGAARRRPASM